MLTKADRVFGSEKDLSLDALADHQVFNVVRQKLENNVQHPDDFKVFLTSSVGWAFDQEPDKRKRKVKPHGVFPALAWLIEKSEEIRQERHDTVVGELNTQIQTLERRVFTFTWVWGHGYDKLLGDLDVLERQTNLGEGHLADRVKRMRTALQTKKAAMRVASVVLAVMAFVALVSGCWFVARKGQVKYYEDYFQFAAANAAEEKAKARIDHYEKNIAPRWDRFWGLGSYRMQAEEQLNQDKKALARAFAKAAVAYVIQMERQLVPAGKSYDFYEVARNCLDRHGDSLEASEKTRLEEMRAPHKAAWSRGIEDRRAYAEIRAISITNGAQMKACEGLVRKYLSANNHDQIMKTAVQSLRNQIDNAKMGEYQLTARRVLIPNDSDAIPGVGRFAVTCQVSVNNSSWSSPRVLTSGTRTSTGWIVDINSAVGRLKYNGYYGPLTVNVRFVSEGNTSWCKLDSSFGDDHFVPLTANRTLSFTCKNGKKIDLELGCTPVQISPLPAFEAK